MHIPLLLVATLLATTSPTSAARPKNAILLSEVSTLTLRSNAPTTHRRVPAIPQLTCISSPSLCRLYQIDLMRCTNSGSSYGTQDIEWSCTASLPEEVRLGSTDVVCEGYAYAEDEYVLKGSCGVEYRLVLTDVGENKYPELVRGREGWDWVSWVFVGVFFGVLGWILYSACLQGQRNQRLRTGRIWGGGGGGWGGGGGGGGGWGPGWGPGGDNTDPPPPYSKTWQPGFWSGLAGGAAAGYMAGNRNRNRDRDDYYYDRPRRYGAGGLGGGRGMWGGGGGGAGDSYAGPSSSSSSTTRQESTGFGSTRRR